MYFGGRHELTVVETVDLPFKCAGCGIEKTARIAAEGHGVARSPFFIGGRRANERAITNAITDAHALAETALKGVACPACGHRVKTGTKSTDVLAVVALTAAGGVGGLLLRGGDGMVIGVCAGTLVGLLTALAARRRATNTAAGVRWFDGEPPDKPVIGKKCKVCTKRIVMASEGMRCEHCGAALHTKKCSETHARKAHGPEGAETPYRS